jgi:hypothetical protein
MEEIEDFFEWAKNIQIPEVTYFALYDPDSGKIKSITPDYNCVDEINKIEVDKDIAHSILEGKTSIRSYRMDLIEGKLEFVEVRSLSKIDDILHRVIEDKWTTVTENDISIVVNENKSEITFKLNEKYKNKKMFYAGSTQLQFFLTEYNDPNIWFTTFVFSIDDIKKSDQTFNYELPSKFSFYTRRILKNYVFTKL